MNSRDELFFALLNVIGHFRCCERLAKTVPHKYSIYQMNDLIGSRAIDECESSISVSWDHTSNSSWEEILNVIRNKFISKSKTLEELTRNICLACLTMDQERKLRTIEKCNEMHYLNMEHEIIGSLSLCVEHPKFESMLMEQKLYLLYCLECILSACFFNNKSANQKLLERTRFLIDDSGLSEIYKNLTKSELPDATSVHDLLITIIPKELLNIIYEYDFVRDKCFVKRLINF